MDDIKAAMSQALVPQPKPTTHDVTIVTTKKLARARVMGVPPEEFGIERSARTIRDANYAFHDIVTKTEGQLIAEGFDETQIRALPEYAGFDNIETFARDTAFENTPSSSVNTSTRLVKITEHYIRMDYEGNGKPCLYMVITAGNDGQVLSKDNEDCVYPIDAIPFAATTPIPVTHRFFGRSIADVTMELQRQKTAMKRGALDNLYLHNAPRPVVSESHAGPNTIDDILTVRQGAPIRMKQPGGIEWQAVPDITGSIYPMMQYLDAELETRTGVSKQSQGIDANALQNQSATAVAQVFSSSQMRMKLIARIMAEGVKDIFSLLHGVVRKHGQQAQTVRLRNKWVDVDPRNWKTREDMTIHVGLGNGSKAQQFSQVMAIANFQKELILGGKTNLVDDQALFNTGAELIKLTGHKNPDKFLNDPSARDPQTGQLLHPPAQPPPDPAMVKVQADMQMKQLELQQRDKEIALNAEATQQADERKAQIEAVQAQADIATQDRKAATEVALTQQKFEFEAMQAEREFQLEKELKLMEFGLKQQQHNDEMQMRREQHQQGLQTEAVKLVAGAESHNMEMESKKASREVEKEAHADDRDSKREERTENRKDREVEREAKKEEAKPTEALAKKVDKLEKLVKAPRKRTLVRDKDGKPSHTIETIEE